MSNDIDVVKTTAKVAVYGVSIGTGGMGGAAIGAGIGVLGGPLGAAIDFGIGFVGGVVGGAKVGSVASKAIEKKR